MSRRQLLRWVYGLGNFFLTGGAILAIGLGLSLNSGQMVQGVLRNGPLIWLIILGMLLSLLLIWAVDERLSGNQLVGTMGAALAGVAVALISVGLMAIPGALDYDVLVLVVYSAAAVSACGLGLLVIAQLK